MTTPGTLHFPQPAAPAPGEAIEVASGIFWIRLALPFQLNHVNIYLIEDGDGYAVVDTGIGNAATQAAWQALLDGMLKSRPPTRIIATHFHPDHVGMAGWLCERLGVPLLMSQTEYLTTLTLIVDPRSIGDEPFRSFYARQGMSAALTETLLSQGNRYLRMVTGVPRTFQRLVAGDALRIGRRRFDVLSGGGHAPEQIMLFCADESLLLGADQVLARISPNISVQAMDPSGDPLGLFLRSLSALQRDLPADTLVLPGHDRPFVGLHQRVDELRVHHQSRCDAILQACRERACTTAELVPVVFRRPIDDPHQLSFAFGEALAHVNRLLHDGRLRDDNGRYRAI